MCNKKWFKFVESSLIIIKGQKQSVTMLYGTKVETRDDQFLSKPDALLSFSISFVYNDFLCAQRSE